MKLSDWEKREYQMKKGDLVNIFIDNCNPSQGVVVNIKERQTVSVGYRTEGKKIGIKYETSYQVLRGKRLLWFAKNELEKIEE